MFVVRRPVASDSTKCVQSEWITSPISGCKNSYWCMLRPSVQNFFFLLFFFFFFLTPHKMGAETSQKLARVLERKHYLLMSAQVKCREEEEGGKMFWLTENKRKRKKCKENIIPGFFFSLNQRWHFPPAFQTMPSHCVFACPFFCCSGVSAKRERVKINQRNHTFPTTILLFLTCIWAHCLFNTASKVGTSTKCTILDTLYKINLLI